MKIILGIAQLRKIIAEYKLDNHKISFVPTMGSLHDGHLSLVKYAIDNSDKTIVSIFVNKAQFNDENDYQLYPKDYNRDIDKLKNLNPDIVFIPDINEIYEHDFAVKISLTKYQDCLCGKSRIGHFDGVAIIITKLFNLVKPNVAIFGEKDFQQLLIIKKLVKDLNFDIEIIALPTMREASGLAMSSRNSRLSIKARIKASLIFQTLNEIRENPSLIENKKKELISAGFEKIDYLEIRSENDLKLIKDINSKDEKRIFIAIYLEGIRLIDNIKI